MSSSRNCPWCEHHVSVSTSEWSVGQVSILHRKFLPLGEKKERRSPVIHIMWTSVGKQSESRTWFPDHFVPLLRWKSSEVGQLLDNETVEVPEDNNMDMSTLERQVLKSYRLC